jgi:P27 family predicted phage terminase small subunit
MARPRRPTALRIVEGNPGHRPLPPNEPQLDVGATMPPGLSPAAQAQWPTIAAQLTDARLLTQLDALALAELCEVFARWRDACDKLSTLGTVVKTERGGIKLSPFWCAFTQASGELRRLLTEFGMTPAARARVAAVKEHDHEDDPFATF